MKLSIWMNRKRFWRALAICIVLITILHLYTVSWFDITRQHDPMKHLLVLLGIVNFEPYSSYNSPYYYMFVGLLSSPFAALYKMHLIDSITFFWLAVIWSSFIFKIFYFVSSLILAQTLRFRFNEQFLFATFCFLIPPIQRSLSMLRPENLILVLTPLVCALLIKWWRGYRNGVPIMNFPNAYLILVILALISAQKISGMILVGLLIICAFIFMGGSWLSRVQTVVRPSLIFVGILVALLSIDKFSDGLSIFEHHAYERSQYSSIPEISAFTKINLKKAWDNPLRDHHADSMINILLIDLFGDYWQYGILQDHGQPEKWNIFRARVGIGISIVFVSLYAISFILMMALFLTRKKKSLLDYEKLALSSIYFFGIITLIITALEIYNPSKFDTIKWEYIVMYIPFMMIPIIHLLSEIREEKVYKGLIILFSIILVCTLLQGVWLPPIKI